MKRFHLHVSVANLDESIRGVTDPTGIAWESFHTLGSIPIYGVDTPVFDHGTSTVPAEKQASGKSE